MMQIHWLEQHYRTKFGCGILVSDLVDKEENYSLFNKLRSTTWREITCEGCLEAIYNKKKSELNAIAEKLGPAWKVRT